MWNIFLKLTQKKIKSFVCTCVQSRFIGTETIQFVKSCVHAKRKIEMYSAAQWIENFFSYLRGIVWNSCFVHMNEYINGRFSYLLLYAKNVILCLFDISVPLIRFFCWCTPVRRSLNIRHNWIEIGRLVYCLLNEEDDYLVFG